jgi:hypothetical protein
MLACSSKGLRGSVCAVAIAAVSVSCAASLRAQSAASPADSGRATPRDPHAVQPERPTVATHAGTVAPGYLEIETGIERDRYPATHVLSLPTTLKIGAGSREQLGIAFAGIHGLPAGGDATGIGDLTVDLKIRLLDDAPALGDFAVLPAIKLPTGSTRNGFGTGTTDVSLLLISSHEFGPVEMDVNAGATHRSGDGGTAPTTSTLWTASFGWPVAGVLGWVAELYGYPGTGGPAGSAPIVAVLTGPTFAVRPWLALDTGFITPLDGPQPHALYAGLVWNAGCIAPVVCKR